jgi:hypothetical protein
MSLVGFIVCVALPWYSVTLEKEQTIRAKEDIFVWSSGTFRVSWNVWAVLALFLTGAFASRALANHQRINGLVLGLLGVVNLVVIAIIFLTTDLGSDIPQIRGQQRVAAPFAAASAAILLVFVAIELFRTAETHRSGPDDAKH